MKKTPEDLTGIKILWDTVGCSCAAKRLNVSPEQYKEMMPTDKVRKGQETLIKKTFWNQLKKDALISFRMCFIDEHPLIPKDFDIYLFSKSVFSSFLIWTLILIFVPPLFWLAIPCLALLCWASWTVFRVYWQQWSPQAVFKEAVKNTISVVKDEVQQSDVYQKVVGVREKVTGVVGFGNATETIQNTLFTMFSAISATVLAAIVWRTWTFIQSKKEKILEGSSPAALVPAYLRALGATLAFVGVSVAGVIKMNTFMNAVNNVSRTGDQVFMKDSKKAAKKGKFTETHYSISQIIPQLSANEVLTSDLCLQALYTCKENYPGEAPVRGHQEILNVYNGIIDKVSARYPGIGFIQVNGYQVPDFKTSIGQALANDIIKSVKKNSSKGDFFVGFAQLWATQLQFSKNKKYVSEFTIHKDSGAEVIQVGKNTQCIPYIAGFLYATAGLPDPYSLKLYVCEYDGQKFRVIAQNIDSAKKILQDSEKDSSVMDMLGTIKEMCSEHSYALTGIALCSVVTYLAFYYYFKSGWVEKKSFKDKKEIEEKEAAEKKKKKELKSSETNKTPAVKTLPSTTPLLPIKAAPTPISKPLAKKPLIESSLKCSSLWNHIEKNFDFDYEGSDRGNRGTRIAKADFDRRMEEIRKENQDWDQLVKNRDDIRKELKDIKASRYADIREQYYTDLPFYDEEINRFSTELSALEKDIEKIYNGEMGDVVKHTNQSKKNTWGTRAQPASEKKHNLQKQYNADRKKKPEAQLPSTTTILSLEERKKAFKAKPIPVEPAKKSTIPKVPVYNVREVIGKKDKPKYVEKDQKTESLTTMVATAKEYVRKVVNRPTITSIPGDIKEDDIENVEVPLPPTEKQEKKESVSAAVRGAVVAFSKVLKRENAPALFVEKKEEEEKRSDSQLVVQEATVADPTNVDSVHRQIPNQQVKAIAPIYVRSDKALDDATVPFVRWGVCFRAKNIDTDKINIYTAYHVVRDRESWIKIGENLLEVLWTRVGRDFAMSEDCSNIPGRVFKIDPNNRKRPTDLRLYTLCVTDDAQRLANCHNGVWSDDNFSHKTDTFNHQCGSPYVTDNTVEAFHTSTSYDENHAIAVFSSGEDE